MDEEFARNVEEVMAYLAANGRSKSTERGHRECYSQLASFLQDNRLPYSEAAAWEWFEGVAAGLGRTSRSIYAGALGKLGDLYSTGEIKPLHCRAQTKADRLYEKHRQLVDGYCELLGELGRAEATVGNHRGAAVRFLLDLQLHDVEFVADATYDDLIRFLLACDGMAYYAKTGYREKVRSFLAYLHSEGLVRYGFTLLVDAMTLKKGFCWNDVDRETIGGLRAAQGAGGGALPLEDYLGLVEELANEHRDSGYSRGTVCSVSHFGGLLYLFMDANGLRYEPRVGRAWLESIERALSRGEFSACRRTVMLLERGYRGVPRDLARAFRFGETLRDRLPGWCAPQVDSFLAMKAAEGWKSSTLVMFRTCTCRFCMFLDGIGVTGFEGVAAEHVKRFNVEDAHATPGGGGLDAGEAHRFEVERADEGVDHAGLAVGRHHVVERREHDLVPVPAFDERHARDLPETEPNYW